MNGAARFERTQTQGKGFTREVSALGWGFPDFLGMPGERPDLPRGQGRSKSFLKRPSNPSFLATLVWYSGNECVLLVYHHSV